MAQAAQHIAEQRQAAVNAAEQIADTGAALGDGERGGGAVADRLLASTWPICANWTAKLGAKDVLGCGEVTDQRWADE